MDGYSSGYISDWWPNEGKGLVVVEQFCATDAQNYPKRPFKAKTLINSLSQELKRRWNSGEYLLALQVYFRLQDPSLAQDMKCPLAVSVNATSQDLSSLRKNQSFGEFISYDPERGFGFIRLLYLQEKIPTEIYRIFVHYKDMDPHLVNLMLELKEKGIFLPGGQWYLRRRPLVYFKGVESTNGKYKAVDVKLAKPIIM